MAKKSFLRESIFSKRENKWLEQKLSSLEVLPIESVSVTDNIRMEIDQQEINILAESIKQNGLINPITVQKKSEDTFELIAGARRFLAVKLLGWKEVPVRVMAVTDDEIALIRLAENLDRADLSGIEVCYAVFNLVERFNKSQVKVAELIGRDKSYVSRCVSVVNSKPEVSRVKHLSLRQLFKLYAMNKGTSQRKNSGPIPGGHAVDRVFRLSERRSGKAFKMTINFDFERSSAGDKDRLIRNLQNILRKLLAE